MAPKPFAFPTKFSRGVAELIWNYLRLNYFKSFQQRRFSIILCNFLLKKINRGKAGSDHNANAGMFLRILQLVIRHGEIVMNKLLLLQQIYNAPVTKNSMRLLTFMVGLCDSPLWI